MLEVKGLTKRYSGIPVVNSVSFTVRPFEVLGYLGPNGSGKSTTAKMLAGLVGPTQGDILFQGKMAVGVQGKQAQDSCFPSGSIPIMPSLRLISRCGGRTSVLW